MRDQTKCDHKFVDSTSCLKCGWTPPTQSSSAQGPGSALRAAEKMDWIQVALNGGPPCFHVDADDGRFCGREERWEGHVTIHKFVSLAGLLRTMTPDSSLRESEIESLLREVMRIHADSNSPEYNQCDNATCSWCVRAARVIQNTKL